MKRYKKDIDSKIFAVGGISLFPSTFLEWAILFFILVVGVLILQQIYELIMEPKNETKKKKEQNSPDKDDLYTSPEEQETDTTQTTTGAYLKDDDGLDDVLRDISKRVPDIPYQGNRLKDDDQSWMPGSHREYFSNEDRGGGQGNLGKNQTNEPEVRQGAPTDESQDDKAAEGSFLGKNLPH